MILLSTTSQYNNPAFTLNTDCHLMGFVERVVNAICSPFYKVRFFNMEIWKDIDGHE